MIKPMPRKLPPHVYQELTRHKKRVYYFRMGHGERVRLPEFPSDEFDAAYKAALMGAAVGKPRESKAAFRSMRWLVENYMASADWAALSVATRKQRGLIFKAALEKSAEKDCRSVTGADILRAIDKRKATPFLAANFLKAMRGLFAWALTRGHVDTDPTSGVKAPTVKTEGFPAWTVEDARAYCARWPIGTRERLAFEMLLHSGLRRSDMHIAGRQHLTGNVLTIRPHKSRKSGVTVTIELPQALIDIIDQTPTGALHFIVGEKGKPYTAEAFSNWFRDACRAAGVSKSAHGVRKLSATLSANAGATVHDMMAQYGWTTFRQAEIYTKGAERVALGIKNSKRLAEQIEAAKIPHLNPKIPHLKKGATKSNG